MRRSEDWNQVRNLHLVRDERDREVQASAQNRAGHAVLLVSQLLAAVCLLREDVSWMAFLSLSFVSGAVRFWAQYRCDREAAYLVLGLLSGAAAAALLCGFLLWGETGLSVGRLAAFAGLCCLLSSLTGLVFVGLLLAVFWISGRLGRMDGERWETYFQSVSTAGLLLRGGGILLLALTLTAVLSCPLFSLLGFPTPARLSVIFFAATGTYWMRKLSEQREELVRKMLRLKP